MRERENGNKFKVIVKKLLGSAKKKNLVFFFYCTKCSIFRFCWYDTTITLNTAAWFFISFRPNHVQHA